MSVDPQVTAFLHELGTRFDEFAMHTLDLATTAQAADFLSRLSFATGEKDASTLPPHMVARGFRSPDGTVCLLIAGAMSVAENCEIRRRAQDERIGVRSQAVGDSAMAALSAAVDRLKAEDATPPRQDARHGGGSAGLAAGAAGVLEGAGGIRFGCPRCRRPLRVAARAAGKTVTCPKCRAEAVVPARSEESRPAALAHGLMLDADGGGVYWIGRRITWEQVRAELGRTGWARKRRCWLCERNRADLDSTVKRVIPIGPEISDEHSMVEGRAYLPRCGDCASGDPQAEADAKAAAQNLNAVTSCVSLLLGAVAGVGVGFASMELGIVAFFATFIPSVVVCVVVGKGVLRRHQRHLPAGKSAAVANHPTVRLCEHLALSLSPEDCLALFAGDRLPEPRHRELIARAEALRRAFAR